MYIGVYILKHYFCNNRLNTHPNVPENNSKIKFKKFEENSALVEKIEIMDLHKNLRQC